MRHRIWSIGSAILILSLLIWAPVGAQDGEPTLEEQIEEAVVKSLAWLVSQQAEDGSWGGWDCERVAATGLVVLKLETRAIELGLDPLSPEYEYATQVSAGLAYILAHTYEQTIGMQPAGDPDGDGDGIAVAFLSNCGQEIYNTGIAMMALAASGHPELYGDTLQDAVDYMAWTQKDNDCGLHRGGWHYAAIDGLSDNSNSGYATLGLGYAAAAPPWGFGLTVPQFVKDELSIWVDVVQDDVNGDTDDGGSYYNPAAQDWVNILKTGNLIYEMGLSGDTAETQRVQDAVDYIERHWNDAGGCGTGWKDHRQATFAMMKGLEALDIEMLDLDGDGEAEHDWFEEVALHLIATQNEDGSWPMDCWAGRHLSTAWALLTLEKAVPAFEIPVPIDIKPESCPNPINTKSQGVLPVAIAGMEDLDVSQIDAATVRLAGVAPLRWTLEDVTTPYEPYLGKEDAHDCIEGGPDGYMDMGLEFDTQEIVSVLGEVHDRDVLVLHLQGNLLEEFGGTPIVGEDVVIILKKAK